MRILNWRCRFSAPRRRDGVSGRETKRGNRNHFRLGCLDFTHRARSRRMSHKDEPRRARRKPPFTTEKAGRADARRARAQTKARASSQTRIRTTSGFAGSRAACGHWQRIVLVHASRLFAFSSLLISSYFEWKHSRHSYSRTSLAPSWKAR